MKPQPFVVNPKDYPKALNVVGEQITVLASGAATQGYEVFLQQGPEGSGPPPHTHPWDETFYIIDGVAEFHLEKKRLVAQPGTLVHIPAGTTHWFRLGKGGAEMLSITSRQAASRLFAEISREISPAKPELDKLVGIAARHEVTMLA